MTVTPWISLALGVALLLFGRRLFWLFVAVAGFLVGTWLADSMLSVDSETARLGVSLGIGVLAALAAVFVQRAAIALAGAAVAGYGAWWYFALGATSLEVWQWIVVSLAATTGLLLARSVFEIGLVALSSLAGAVLVLEGLTPPPEVARWAVFALAIVGAAIQVGGMRSGRR